LGGAWTKIGQALALRFDLLNPAFCYELFELLNQTKPFSYEEVRKVIRTELQNDPEKLFAVFDREPFAAASIGQVHRALLSSGEKVAVKVQRPEVRDAMAVDIAFLYVVAGIIDCFSILGSMSPRSFVRQFELSVSEELNFKNEARHAQMMADKARHHDVELNAKVFLEYTTERVLTTDLLEGLSLLSLLRPKGSDNQTNQFEKEDIENICRNLLHNTLRQIFGQAYFHADIHPANVFILPDNVIGYIDFGIVGTLSNTLRNSLTYYAMQLFRGDIERSTQELMRWITHSSRTDFEAARSEILAIAEEYYCSVSLNDGGNDPQNSFASYQINVLNAVRRHHMAISPSIVAAFRVLISVITMIYHLNPKFPLRQHANQYFSNLLLSDAIAWLSPQEIMRRAFDLNLRFERAVDALERERQVESLVGSRRRHLKIYCGLGIVTIIVLVSVYLYGPSVPKIAVYTLLVGFFGGCSLFAIFALRELFTVKVPKKH